MKKLKNNTLKKTRIIKVMLFTLILANTSNCLAQNNFNKIHFGFIYPISTNGTHAPLDSNNLSIHLIAGVSAAERGLIFSGFANIIRKDAVGFQIAGFSNHIGGKADGTQLAGFANIYNGGKGVAFAGFSNVAHNDVIGTQFAGFANIAKNVKGAQFAGFANIANKNVTASQFSGFINKASNVNGAQVAGFINIAKKVKGLQIVGFINIADSSDYPLGLINIIKNGEKSIGLAMDETETLMLSFRSGGKKLYGILGVGYNFKNTVKVYALEFGFGLHLFPLKSFSLNTEIVGSTLANFKPGEYFKSTLRLMPALKIFKGLALYAGPSLNFVTTNTTEGKLLHTKNIASWDKTFNNNFNALNFGYNAGLKISF